MPKITIAANEIGDSMTSSAKKEAAHHARQIGAVGEPMLTLSDLCDIFQCHRVTIWSRVRIPAR